MDEAKPRITVTSTALLEGLKDPQNRTVWQDYVDRYRPVLLRYVRELGVPADDAEDLAQVSLSTFAESLREGRYDRDRGRLRSWLFGILKNHLRAHRRRPARELQPRDVSETSDFFADLAARDDLEERWDAEWREEVLAQCLREVRQGVQASTWEAFRLFALEGRPAERVADELGITANAVFGAKRRVLERVRALQPLVEEIF